MKKYIITGIIIAVFLGGLFLLSRNGRGSQTPKAAAQGITVQEAKFDFGPVSMAKGKVNHSFSFKNDSGVPVTVTGLYTSCMCTEATLFHGETKAGPFGMPGHGFNPSIRETINPGETASVEAVFDPAAHGPSGIGMVIRQVVIETDKGLVTFDFSAQVNP